MTSETEIKKLKNERLKIEHEFKERLNKLSSDYGVKVHDIQIMQVDVIGHASKIHDVQIVIVV